MAQKNVFVPCGRADLRDGTAKYARLGAAAASPAKDRPPTGARLTEWERDSPQADSYKNGGIPLICDLPEKNDSPPIAKQE